MAAVRKILFASDFSKASRKALTTAVAMAKANGASLTILHVIVPFTPIVPEQYVDGQTWELIDKEARRWSQRRLRALTNRRRKRAYGWRVHSRGGSCRANGPGGTIDSRGSSSRRNTRPNRADDILRGKRREPPRRDSILPGGDRSKSVDGDDEL